MMKKVIGITGGIGCGKSTVTAYLVNNCGAKAVIMDDLGKMLMQPGHNVYDKIVRAFGREVLNPDMKIDTALLSRAVFADDKKLSALNAIIHPAVIDETLEIINSNSGLIVIETALPGSARLDEYCDEIWYVFAPEEQRIERLIDGRGCDREKWKNIIGKQLCETDFEALADRIIDNSGTLSQTEQQIDNNIKDALNGK